MSCSPLSQTPFVVCDSFHHKLTCLPSQTLGRGGQGVVYRVKDNPLLAVKLLVRSFNENQFRSKDDAYYESLRKLELYPIDPQLHLALPWAYLEDYAGYVMPLLDDVQPVAKLLSLTPQNLEEYLEIYQQIPLRKRFEILLQLSSILANLHAQDLVFGDLSSNNVLVSKIQGQPQVWLIDVDNIRYMGEGTSAHTADYAAPEFFAPQAEPSEHSAAEQSQPTYSAQTYNLPQEPSPVNAQTQTTPSQIQTPGLETNLCPQVPGNTVYTDAFSFAVLAFELLTLERPLTATDFEKDQNQCGKWIYDPEIPESQMGNRELHELLITPELFYLFERTLSARTPETRAPLWLWHAALQRAADLTIECPECHLHYYATFDKCPFCQSAHPPLLQVYRQGQLVLTRELTAPIGLFRHLWGACSNHNETEVYTLTPPQASNAAYYAAQYAYQSATQTSSHEAQCADSNEQNFINPQSNAAGGVDLGQQIFNLHLRLPQDQITDGMPRGRLLTCQELEKGYSLTLNDQSIELKGVWPCALTK